MIGFFSSKASFLKRKDATAFIFVAIISVLSSKVWGQDCEPLDDDNANITGINCTYYATTNVSIGCTVNKTCNKGYSSSIHDILITCTGDGWTSNDICEECTEPNYGTNCSSTTHCSSVCTYNKEIGCDQNSAMHWVDCSLENMKIISESNHISATALIDEKVRVVVYVFVPEQDINNVTALHMRDNSMITPNMSTTDNNVTIFFEVPANKGSEGMYEITVQSNFSRETANVEVKVYEPVEITGIYREGSEEIIAEDRVTVGSKYQWRCEASGSPRPEVNWVIGGSEVSLHEIGERIYQVKSQSSETSATTTLYIRPETGILISDSGLYSCVGKNKDGENRTLMDAATLTLTAIQDPPSTTDPMVYAEKQEFLIAVCVLGVVLAIMLIAFGLALIWLRKHNGDFKKKEKANNNYSGGPHTAHTKKSNAQEEEEYHDIVNRHEPESVSMKMARREKAKTPEQIRRAAPHGYQSNNPGARTPQPKQQLKQQPQNQPRHGHGNFGMSMTNPSFQEDEGYYQENLPQSHPAGRAQSNHQSMPVYDTPEGGTYEEAGNFYESGFDNPRNKHGQYRY